MRQEIYTRPEKEKAFSDIASIVKEYSKELVDRWGSEIETYLVYVRYLTEEERAYMRN